MEPPPEDKRVQRRVEAAIAIRVQGLDSSGQAYDDTTTAVEVSRRGLSFLTKHSLSIFATLTVVIPGRGPMRSNEGPTDFFTEATVVRSVKEDQEFYRVGVRFMGATLPMYSPEGL
ncbi:MAG TPA: PilZ domain-containing protein [Terriglobia bacterium]|nr:PilZ domain-containing protein [Terriglobia bacterium]